MGVAMLTADGLQEAFLGMGRRCGQPDIAVYSTAKCREILQKRDGMTYSEAVEYFEFNIAGAWVGKETPLWLEQMSYQDAINNS